MTRNNGRNSDGTFAAGNPGKPRGSRHKVTRAVADLLDGEAEAITRKAVEMALEGDATALRLCLERVAPARKDSPVTFELPAMSNASEAAGASAAVLTAVAEGNLTPAEGAAVMGLVDSYRRTLEVTEIEQRLAALEAEK
ncbi:MULTISPECIES: DUF5681 domain-containing protein [Roseobacteraceae]|uniref:DUF5681 domain-containing protein n=1 Tax=Roseobacteraceae TaxID=2854170 RepID=UPI0031DB2EC1